MLFKTLANNMNSLKNTLLLIITMVFVSKADAIEDRVNLNLNYSVKEGLIDVALRCHWSTKGSQYFRWYYDVFFDKKSGNLILATDKTRYFDFINFKLSRSTIEKHIFFRNSNAYLKRDGMQRYTKVEINRQKLTLTVFNTPSRYNKRTSNRYSCELYDNNLIQEKFEGFKKRHQDNISLRKEEEQKKIKQKKQDLENKRKNQKI